MRTKASGESTLLLLDAVQVLRAENVDYAIRCLVFIMTSTTGCITPTFARMLRYGCESGREHRNATEQVTPWPRLL